MSVIFIAGALPILPPSSGCSPPDAMEPLVIPPRPPRASCADASSGAAATKPTFFRKSLRLIPTSASVSVYILKRLRRAAVHGGSPTALEQQFCAELNRPGAARTRDVAE